MGLNSRVHSTGYILLGVEQDLNKAKELYEEAAEYEYMDAIEALERLSK